jgi:chemotaxis protein methyltransferase CheR
MLSGGECVDLLQWALPILGLRWRGFRRVRRQVCKRVGRRIADLGLADAGAYRERLAADPAERRVLDGLCRITISRFYRDRAVFDRLGDQVLPKLATLARRRGEATLRCWSAGCASGEEPYTLAIVFRLAVAPHFPGLGLRIVASDVDGAVLARARRGCYARATLRELPAGWRERAFAARGAESCLRPEFRAGVEFRRQDLRERMPEGPFHLVLCRNLAFTYFDEAVQRDVLARLVRRLAPGGFLVVGMRESPPGEQAGLAPAGGRLPIYRLAGRREAEGGDPAEGGARKSSSPGTPEGIDSHGRLHGGWTGGG